MRNRGSVACKVKALDNRRRSDSPEAALGIHLVLTDSFLIYQKCHVLLLTCLFPPSMPKRAPPRTFYPPRAQLSHGTSLRILDRRLNGATESTRQGSRAMQPPMRFWGGRWRTPRSGSGFHKDQPAAGAIRAFTRELTSCPRFCSRPGGQDWGIYWPSTVASPETFVCQSV